MLIIIIVGIHSLLQRGQRWRTRRTWGSIVALGNFERSRLSRYFANNSGLLTQADLWAMEAITSAQVAARLRWWLSSDSDSDYLNRKSDLWDSDPRPRSRQAGFWSIGYERNTINRRIWISRRHHVPRSRIVLTAPDNLVDRQFFGLVFLSCLSPTAGTAFRLRLPRHGHCRLFDGGWAWLAFLAGTENLVYVAGDFSWSALRGWQLLSSLVEESERGGQANLTCVYGQLVQRTETEMQHMHRARLYVRICPIESI
jgi:hypothetical protein